MASQIDIINLALFRIGQKPIAALYPTEKSVEARIATALWEPVLKSVQRAHPWNFTIQTEALVSLSEALPGYDYTYQLPADCIKLIDLIVTAGATPMEWEIWGGNVLVTNQENATVKYCQYVTNTAAFDDQFVETLSYRLAADLVMPITGNPQYLQSMMQLYSSSMRIAKLLDNQETRKSSTQIGQGFLTSRT